VNDLERLWLFVHDKAMSETRGSDLPDEQEIGDGYDSRRATDEPGSAVAAYHREYRRKQALKRGTH
jgi:hypothetical protein